MIIYLIQTIKLLSLKIFNDGIDDIYGLISYDDEDGTYRVSYENITEHLSDREGDFEIVGNIFENPDLHEQLGY